MSFQGDEDIYADITAPGKWQEKPLLVERPPVQPPNRFSPCQKVTLGVSCSGISAVILYYFIQFIIPYELKIKGAP
jgi:hypothetical protein